MIVLDTNIVSESSKPRPDANVRAWLRHQRLEDLYLCAPVVMEQSFGAERYALIAGSNRYLLILEEIVSERFENRILGFDGPAPRLAGKLRAVRERRGRP